MDPGGTGYGGTPDAPPPMASCVQMSGVAPATPQLPPPVWVVIENTLAGIISARMSLMNASSVVFTAPPTPDWPVRSHALVGASSFSMHEVARPVNFVVTLLMQFPSSGSPPFTAFW